MLYTAKFTLRLALGVSLVACLCLGVAKAGGVLFNHSNIYVYVDGNDFPLSSYLTIYLLDVERNLVSRLTPHNTTVISSDCSTDGRIAFVARMHNLDFDIHVIDMFERRIINVTDEPKPNYIGGWWSPDGQILAFLTLTTPSGGDIYIADFRNNSPQQITFGERIGEPLMWSPDGTQLLYISHRRFPPEIYTVIVDGYIQRRLTENTAFEQSPIWSPDGRAIAFISNYDGDYDIYRIDSDGTNQRQFTNTVASEKYLAWSPDGKYLASISDDPSEVRIMDADGYNSHLLTDNSFFNNPPQWSPDGQYLTFVESGNAGNFINIYFISSDRSDFRLLTRIMAGVSRPPIWCP